VSIEDCGSSDRSSIPLEGLYKLKNALMCMDNTVRQKTIADQKGKLIPKNYTNRLKITTYKVFHQMGSNSYV
ncbi:MAG: hypothetical protein OES34_09405, partial [Nitrosopumilus sp.]|nr:hypothetical protein [Nitrosopumilus sp.]